MSKPIASAELNQAGQLTRQYIYLADMPIAVIDTPQGKPLSNEELSAHVLLGLDAQNILKYLWQGITGSDGNEQTAWLHVNHLGAPEAVTDSEGQLIWQASYAPFGAAKIIKASAGKSNDSSQFTLNLRLPGQYFDAETGLFYNKHRYYDPARGEYLTPDPLGAPDGPNGYSYVRYNPLKYVDPDGLILFAFDGTGNDRSLSNTNVWLLSQLYDENDPEVDRGLPYYIQGAGTGDAAFGTSWLDGGIGFSMTDRINQQLDALDRYVKTKTPLEKSRRQISRQDPLVVTLDIVGFSRGSAEARDFVNQVISRRDANYYRDKTKGFSGDCVSLNIRFMGLFDTVLAAGGVGRRDFNMAIPASVQYVAQAVAANEHRSKFQLESIQSSFPGNTGSETTARGWRVERGFVGAHADIGGGYNGTQGGDGSDLSDVALNWMYDRFNELGIKMKDMSATYRTVSNPVLHDERNSYPFSAPIGGAPLFGEQDRNVHYPMAGGQSVPEKTAQIRGLTNAQTAPFITRNGSSGNAVGTVDMAKYNDWLRRNYGVNMQ